jgi:prefoldin subunit 5
LRNWDGKLNADLSNAQRTLEFLDQSAARLQGLKLELSAKLTGRLQQTGSLQHKVRQFDGHWQQRLAATGGSLDSQLAYDGAAAPSQRFTVRGLTLQILQSGAKETLTFSLGAGQPLRSVIVEPGLSEEAIVQRFDNALAPAQIRVAKGDGGALVFSVAESAWSAVRDTLAIKGDGMRFPTGQFNRARTVAEPPALQPETWQISDLESLRKTLQQVVQALAHVHQAREAVNRALDEAVSRAHAAQSEESAAVVTKLTQDFLGISARSEYQIFSSVVAAVVGISRSRVLALLALRS